MTTRSQASSPGGKLNSNINDNRATTNGTPATLSVLDLKSQLLSSMKKNGVLGNLKAQLRTQFLSELKSLAKEGGRGGPFDVNRHRGQKQNLRTRVLNTLFLEHLRSMGYKYSLSVFLPESGVNTAPPLSKLEILQILNIRQGHSFYTKLAATLGELKKPLLEQSSNAQRDGQNTLISAILEGLESSSTLHDSCTQTDEGNTPSERLLKRLDDVEHAYRQQQKSQVGHGTSASIEDRLIQYQRNVDRKGREEIAAEIERIKSVEIQQMKMEERAHHRATLEVELRRLQEEHKRQMKAMEERKNFVEEQMRRREREMEKTSFEHRQQILKEMEMNRLREEDIQRSSELEKRSLELEKARIEDMDKEFLRERKRFEADRAEWSRRCESDMNQFKVDIRRQYQAREQDIEKKEKRLNDDRNAFVKEQADGRVIIAEAQAIKDELEGARKTAQNATQKANSLALELAQVQEHLRIVANAANGDRDGHRKATELNESLTRQLAKAQQDMVDSRNRIHKQIEEKETLIRALGERLADEQSKNAQLQRKHGEEIRDIRSGQDDGIDKLKDSLRWKDNELISQRSEMENRINSLQRDLDLVRPRLEEAETNLSIKETEIVELKNLLQKARLALDKVTQNSNEEYSSKQNTVSLNDPNALLASLRKRRAGRIQEQTLVPPPAQYLYMNRPPPMMYPPSWQAHPPPAGPQQQQQQQQQQQNKSNESAKDAEIMKLKLEKLEEERKKRELAAEIERKNMEEKFKRLKDEHEEKLLQHEMAVINAKERSADIVEDAAKLLREEKQRNEQYRSEIQDMKDRIRKDTPNSSSSKNNNNMNTKTILATKKSSPEEDGSSSKKLKNTNIEENNKFETPNVLNSTPPTNNNVKNNRSPSPSATATTTKKMPSPIQSKQKSAAEIEKEKAEHKEKMMQVRLEEKRKLDAARAQREQEKQERLQKEAERKRQEELKAEKERLEKERLEKEKQLKLEQEAKLKKEQEQREEELRKQKELEEIERKKSEEQKREELKQKKEEEEKQRLKEEGEKKLKARMDEIRKSRELKKKREEEAAALKKMSAVTSPVQKEDSYGDDSWGSLPLDESSGIGNGNKKGDSSDAFDLSGMNDDDEIEEDDEMEVYEVGSDSPDDTFDF